MITTPRGSAALLTVLLSLAVPLAGRAEEGAPAPAPDAAQAPAAVPAPTQPEAVLGEDLVVTATRSPRPIRDVPATVRVLPRAELERTPAKSTDELLVTVPSFDMFRRSSSLAADPSSQGVKLRGVGGTAAARALVLLDGVPVNDSFAGWVPWRAFPSLGLERIEVVPGGGAALYGNYALGGVIQVFSRPIRPQDVAVAAETGSFGTDRFQAHVADRAGPVGLAADVELFGSRGYLVVAPASRGAVDQGTASDHQVVSGRLEAQASSDLDLALRASFFNQDQNGGTVYTTSAYRRVEVSGGATWRAGEAGQLALTVFGHSGDFKQSRARVATGRVSEVQSGHQDVPSSDLGTSLLWQARPLRLAGTHTLSVGLDARWISGTTDEHLFPATVTPTSVLHQVAKGRQALQGIFVQDVAEFGEAVEATLALRYDRWTNTAASRVEELGDGSSAPTPFADRSDQQVDPKLGVRVHLTDWLTARGSVYRAFRAPTLDELYRPFTVGPVRTLPNENLSPETLTGGEAGLEVATPHGAGARLTGFWNELDNPVTNVTIGTNLRQKQNLGTARIRGVEATADWHPTPRWALTGAYTFIDAKVTAAPGNPPLVGKRLAQNPNYRATVGLAWDDPRLAGCNAQVRWLGQQYEDDLNTLPLHEAALVDLFAAWHASREVDLFGGVSNLLDKTYLVGRAGGLETIGQPRFVHVGLKFVPGR